MTIVVFVGSIPFSIRGGAGTIKVQADEGPAWPLSLSLGLMEG